MKVIFITRRWIILFWVLLGIALFLLYALKLKEDRSISAVFSSPVKEKIIVIDAGHGGFDPGAVSDSGTREDEINLKIANKLRIHLKDLSAKIELTLKTDGEQGKI